MTDDATEKVPPWHPDDPIRKHINERHRRRAAWAEETAGDVSTDRFVVKIQAPLETITDVDMYLLYNEDRSVELLIPAGVNETLDDAMQFAETKRIFCYAQVVARKLLLDVSDYPGTDPEW